MLLPQSSAFAALKNRLNSVSSIGYLHIAPRPYVSSSNALGTHSRQGSVAETVNSFQNQAPRSKSVHDTHVLLPSSSATTPSTSNYDRPNRLKGPGREENAIRWDQLLEKFRSVQDKARRAQRLGGGLDEGPDFGELRFGDGTSGMKDPPRPLAGPPVPQKDPPPQAPPQKKGGIGRQFGRLGGAVAGRGKRSQG
jgi:vacuole morphology and inheritance protein 14